MISLKIGENEYKIKLKGIIGLDVSGIDISDEIDYLNTIGAERIVLEINSAGGDVTDGFNIISSILESKASVETFCTGVAASMAAVILSVGSKRSAYNFSTGLIHDPQLDGVTLEEIEDIQKKENLTRIKDSLSDILQNACGKPKNEIDELMTREAVMSAKEMKKFGMIDSVVKTKFLGAAASVKSLSLMEYQNLCENLSDQLGTKKSTKKMDKITNHLKLNSDASEDSILKSIQAIQKASVDAQNDLTEAQNKLTEKESELKTAQDKLAQFEELAITNAVNAAIETGKFGEDKREFLTNQAKSNLEMFTSMVENMPQPHSSTLEQITNQKKDKDKDKKDWDWYQKNDPQALKNLEISNKAEFDRLYDEYCVMAEKVTN